MGNQKEKLKHLFRDKQLSEVKHASKRVSAIVLSAVGILSCVFAVIGVFLINANKDAFRLWISEHFFLGALAVILICALQVIVALVPGEVVEILSGYVFGTWMGALLCMIGITLGSVLVILLTRRLGRRFVETFYSREKIDALPVLRDPAKRNAMTFFLFLLPGTPKDLLTYIIGLTEMSVPLYLLLTTVARFPSVISSTMGGGALGSSKFSLAFWVFLITACVSAIGYGIYLLIQKKNKAKQDRKDPF